MTSDHSPLGEDQLNVAQPEGKRWFEAVLSWSVLTAK
jgi:hypothetical protein